MLLPGDAGVGCYERSRDFAVEVIPRLHRPVLQELLRRFRPVPRLRCVVRLEDGGGGEQAVQGSGDLVVGVGQVWDVPDGVEGEVVVDDNDLAQVVDEVLAARAVVLGVGDVHRVGTFRERCKVA